MTRRPRGRGRKPQHNKNQNPNRAMDSNGPDVRVRGSAKTIYEKYISLARDAASSGQRVKAENLLQHAEHYLRIVKELQAEAELRAEQQAKLRAEKQAEREAEIAEKQQGSNDEKTQETPEIEDEAQAKTNKPNGRARSYLGRRRSKAKTTDTKTDNTKEDIGSESKKIAPENISENTQEKVQAEEAISK